MRRHSCTDILQPVILSVLFLSSLCCASRYASKGAYISLSAKWNSTSLLSEAGEFVAEEDPAFFWQFLDNWHQQTSADAAAGTCWERTVAAGRKLLSKYMTQVFQLAVGVRQYSPKLEMYHQLALEAQPSKDSCCWAQIGGTTVSDPSMVSSLIASALAGEIEGAGDDVLYALDHVYPGVDAASLALDPENDVVVVVYGPMGSSCFSTLHASVLQAVKDHDDRQGGHRVIYAYRPALLDNCPSNAIGGLETCATHGAGGQLQLPGFGTEFVLKNMEYKTLDDQKKKSEEAGGVGGDESGPAELKGFLFHKLIHRKPQLKKELLAFRDHLLEASLEEDTLKMWDMKDLGVQAAQRVLQASDPLFILTELSQNFPSLARSVSQMAVNKNIAREIQENQRMLPAGRNLMVLNGVLIDMDELDLFKLIDRIRDEIRLADALAESGLGQADVSQLMLLRSKVAASSSPDVAVGLNDDERILWLNNIEKDDYFKRFSKNVLDILQPLMPGRMHRIGLNLFNVVVVARLDSFLGLSAAQGAVEAVRDRYPVRIGVLPDCPQVMQKLRSRETSPSPWEHTTTCEKVGRALMTLVVAFGNTAGTLYLKEVAEAWASSDPESQLQNKIIESSFKERWAANTRGEPSGTSSDDAWSDVMAGSGVANEATAALLGALEYVDVKGVSGGGPASMYVNGMLQNPMGQDWRSSIIISAFYETQALQEMVYFGRVTGASRDVYAEILKARKAVPRFNPRIFSDDDDEGVRKVRLAGPLLSPRRSPALSSLQYLHRPGTEDAIKPISMVVITDFNTEYGRSMVSEALQYILNDESADPARLAVLYNPANSGAPPSTLQRIFMAASMLSSRRGKIPGFLVSLLDRFGGGQLDGDELLEAAETLAEESGLNTQGLKTILGKSGSVEGAGNIVALHAELARSGLNLRSGASAVMTNGRVMITNDISGDTGEVMHMVSADFALLSMFAEQRMYSTDIEQLLEEAALDERAVLPGEDGEMEPMSSEELSDAAMMLSSLLAADENMVDALNVRLMNAVDNFGSKHASVSFQSKGGAPLQFIAFLNPLCKTAQRLSPMLSFIRDALGLGVQLYMNPHRELSDMPLKSFYRYSLPEVTVSGDILLFERPPVAYFNSLPPTKVLTLHMDVPESWLVEAVKAEYDLDNFRPQDLGNDPNMYAEFELEALLLTGSCTDVAVKNRNEAFPRGVQLWLGKGATPHVVDTLVMSNLGYFQLKAQPGIWMLQLAPGRSRELYTIVGSSGVGSHIAGAAALTHQKGASETQVPVIIHAFEGKHMTLKLRKRPGMESEDVLEARKTPSEQQEGSNRNMWGAVSSWLGGKEKVEETKDDVINIFCVASGHMYERLQKIMILSVIKNTKMRVKVWFIKNYMSPQMKSFVPLMAAQYSFDYEFVTYKWPEWLHKQTDKQRIIWAYKILFLDVLFPLDVNKVIFVDSDQVVRGDMAELWNMDLQDAPYAYTPFCDNNKEMDGFRFWKQGFWRDHLRGKPYHISALYVVDLQKFRQIAAGDQLRVIYDSLSRDPNSLANLDQDLPNYAQHQVTIFSLPQEWLWCETWCGNETKSGAKTIDLCNNPLTKEPKLTGARRIVAEWNELDEEARKFTQQVESGLLGQPQVSESATAPPQGESCGAEGGQECASALGHDSSEL